jgi:phage terminase small subunit
MEPDTAQVAQPEIDDNTADGQQSAYRQAQAFLTPAMQAFAEHWAHSRNQIKAYQYAYPGSSASAAKTHARRLFCDGRVQAEIRRVLERWTDHSAVELERIEHELSRIAFADPRSLYDEHGNLKRPHEWDADTAAAVASYTEMNVKGVITRKVRLADKHAAARTLAEMKGAFDKHKAPPGIQASFTINLGAGPIELGGIAQSGRTSNMDNRKPGELTKTRNLPKPDKAKREPAVVDLRPVETKNRN